MPIVKVYQHGMTSGIPPGRNDHLRAKRDIVQGWSSKTARSNTAFLRSVVIGELNGSGFTFTLTVKTCPPDHKDWLRLREAFFRRLLSVGMLRAHWVTEWQRRGVPHLHGMVYFPESTGGIDFLRYRNAIVEGWCRTAAEYGPLPRAQHCTVVTDAVGWLKYLAKHASRGATHYQRAASGIPAGWKKTGRIWGKLGEWPTREAIELNLTKDQYFTFRRIVRAWRLAGARSEGSSARIGLARRMLQGSDRASCEVRGMSEWIPESLQLLMVSVSVSIKGGDVEQV